VVAADPPHTTVAIQDGMIEVANEYAHKGYDRPLLKTHEGQVELALARKTAPKRLVSTSESGSDKPFPAGFTDLVVPACDFVLIHRNLRPLSEILTQAGVRRPGQPVVCNEDRKVGPAGAAAEASVAAGVSCGLTHEPVNQTFPFRSDDPAVYAAPKRLTTPKEK
jgi:hypothetical protein